MVSQIVHSSTTQRLIGGYSQTTCNKHAAAATTDFSEIISEEEESEKEWQVKITEVVHNHQFAKAARMASGATTDEEETELDEEAAKEKAKLQETQD